MSLPRPLILFVYEYRKLHSTAAADLKHGYGYSFEALPTHASILARLTWMMNEVRLGGDMNSMRRWFHMNTKIIAM